MLNLTPQEKRVILFLLIIAFCGITLNNLSKLDCRIKKLYSPQLRLSRIDLNKVTLNELMMTRCLPEATSRKIIAWRQEHGNFKSLEDLRQVKGIGEKRYEKLKGIFFVE